MGALVSLLIGVLYGGISGYMGGLVDDIMMRILEILSGIPYMVMVIIVTVFLGKGMSSLLLALCITELDRPGPSGSRTGAGAQRERVCHGCKGSGYSDP
ncbi:MAG: hypothetical protein ACLR2E_03955 [Lachnospiraceae bacterium]